MSEQYNEYLKEHTDNVQKAGKWLISHFPDILSSEEKTALARRNTMLMTHTSTEAISLIRSSCPTLTMLGSITSTTTHIIGNTGYLHTMMNQKKSWRCIKGTRSR